MSDDKEQRHGQDRTRIDLEQDYEVQYWTRELGVSQGELEEAVRRMGSRVDKVRQYLGR